MTDDKDTTGGRVREVQLRCERHMFCSYVERFGFTLEGPRQQQLTAKNGQVCMPLFYVLRVEKDSPAQEAGLMPGDGILQINDRNVESAHLEDLRRRMKFETDLKLMVISDSNYEPNLPQQLYSAAGDGDLQTLKKLLPLVEDLNQRFGIEKWNPLHAASHNGHLGVVVALIHAGFDLNARDRFGWTPLHHASAGGHVLVVSQLNQAGADVKSQDRDGWIPLHVAADRGYVEIVTELINAGADVNSKDTDRWTPLHVAADRGYVEIVAQLIKAGADVNSKDMNSWTPLHCASMRGCVQVVTELINARADVNARNKIESTPLHSASSKGHLEVAAKLISAGADVNAKNTSGTTALHMAAHRGRLGIATKLVDSGAVLNYKNVYEYSPLRSALVGARQGIVHTLIDEGPDDRSRTKDMRFLLDHAVSRSDWGTARMLLENGAQWQDSAEYSVPCAFVLRSSEDCEHFLAPRVVSESLREEPYSLVISRPPNDVKKILRAVKPVPNFEGLFVTNVNGKLSLEKVFQETCPTVTKLGFMNCGLEGLPEELHRHFPNLNELVLSKNSIKKLPKCIGDFICLHTLRISRNSLRELPDTIGELRNLRALHCAHNKLETLPSTLAKLSDTLGLLDVRHNAIRTLQTTAADLLKKVASFHCGGNPLTKELGSDRKEDVVSYLEALGNGVVDNKEVKLAVVGEEGVGKTTLIQALQAKSKVCTTAVAKTDGIDISALEIEGITFRVFDTAGDADFLETHLLFTSPNCLYLHVFNLSTVEVDEEAGVQLARLEMWLKAIYVQAPDSRNLIVGTHADSVKHSEEMRTVVRRKLDRVLGNARAVHAVRSKDNPVGECSLCPSDLDGPIPGANTSDGSHSDTYQSPANVPHVVGWCEVSSVKKYPATLSSVLSRSNPSIEELKSLLADRARKLLRVVPRTPQKWMDVLTLWRLSTQEKLPVLRVEDAEEIAKRNGVAEHAELSLMLAFFSNTGHIVYHAQVPGVIVLDPQWLADQLCKVISFKKEWIEDGLLTPEDLKTAFQGTYDWLQEQIIGLFRHFRICFPLDDGRELFPCRLPIGMPSSSLWPAVPGKDDRQVSYLCEFSFVPNSLFPEIVVKIHEDRNVDESPQPRFFCNRAIYQMRATPDACDACKVSPPKPQQKYHRVHIELSYPRNAVVVTVRGPKPCCVANSTCEMIKSAAGKNTVVKIGPLCPVCVVENVYEAAQLRIQPDQPAAHIACDAGHELGTQHVVLSGEWSFDQPKPFPDHNFPVTDEDCPRLFVMLPINKDAGVFSRLVHYSLLKDGFAVHFLCEHPGQWHFLSSPGFRLKRLQAFVSKYGGRAYKLLDCLFKSGIPITSSDHVDHRLNEQNGQGSVNRLLSSYDENFPTMKDASSVVNLLEPSSLEDLRRSSLKKLLEISNDEDQPLFPDLVPVRIKGKVLWLCIKHAKASLPDGSRTRPLSPPINQNPTPRDESRLVALKGTGKVQLEMTNDSSRDVVDERDYSDESPALQDLVDLSWAIIPLWQSLGRELGVEQGRIDNISHSAAVLQPNEKAFQVLKLWCDMGRNSTNRQLAHALETLGRQDLARKHCTAQVSQGGDGFDASRATVNGRNRQAEDVNGCFLAGRADPSCEEYSDEAPAADVLATLSAEIIPVWPSLGRRLGLPNSAIDNIVYSLADLEPKQKACKMLMDWRMQSPGSGSRHLAEALKAEGLGRLADEYCLKKADSS